MKKKLNLNRHQIRRASLAATATIEFRRPAARPCPTPEAAGTQKRTRQRERGYTLVALLALMTIMMLALTAAAPSLRQQKQRQLEEETIIRGEEVAEAIRLYVRAKGALPTSIEQLLEGVPPFPGSTKKVQILPAWAARDPLSKSGEWRLVKPNDRALITFQTDVMRYAGNRPVQTFDPAIARFFNVTVTGLVDTGKREEAPCEEDSSSSGNAFIGVASRSCRDSVITYYGIERHDQWVFTPLFR